MSGYNFSGSRLEWNIFSGCKLVGADFSNVFMDWCAFSNANLTKANFRNSMLWDSTFDGATLNDAVFIKTELDYIIFVDAYIGSADFTNSKKIVVYEKWEDTGEENLDAAIAIAERSNLLSTSRLLALKAFLEKYRTKMQKFKAFYDFGRDFINPKGNLNNYTIVGKETTVGGGIYTDKRRSGIYTEKTEYGPKRSKDEKGVRYGK